MTNTTTPSRVSEQADERRAKFDAWYAQQPMPDLLARMDPQQAAFNAWQAATQQAAPEAPTWGPVHTIADMVRNLLTLDQSDPIHAAFHVDYQGERRCRTRPVSISRERVIDGKWVDSARKDVPYAVIVWAKQDESVSPVVAPEAPAGHTVVPLVATRDMLHAGMRFFQHQREPATKAWEVYRAMIAAAPEAPASEQQTTTKHCGWPFCPHTPDCNASPAATPASAPQYENVIDHNGRIAGVRMVNADQMPSYAATTASLGYSKEWCERMAGLESAFDGNIEAGATTASEDCRECEGRACYSDPDDSANSLPCAYCDGTGKEPK